MHKLMTALAVIMLSTQAFAANLTKINVKSVGSRSQFVLYFNSVPNYRYFSLAKPSRLVLDLTKTNLRTSLSLSQFNDTSVRDIRWAEHSGNRLRIVFDLKKPLSSVSVKKLGLGRLQVTLVSKRSEVLGFSWKAKPVLIKPRPTTTQYRLSAPKTQPRSRLKNIVVVIDPGHGGKDPGAIGIGGTQEKNVVLKLSRTLQRLINLQPGFRAVLTRTGDYYLPLRKRLALARKDHADMFVAIHADKWKNRSARGASVFALSRRGATSEAARWLAARENRSELMGGVNLSDKTPLLKSVLINLSQTATIRASLSIGKDIIRQLSQVTALHQPYVEQAAFVVLKSPDIPSLLIESGFLSNPHEERQLRRPSYRRRLAKAILQGINRYFKQHPPRGSWLAYWKKHPLRG